MKKLILVGLAVGLLSGCATWTSDRVAAGVNTYCDRLTPLEREVMRARIDVRTYPNQIRVECHDAR